MSHKAPDTSATDIGAPRAARPPSKPGRIDTSNPLALMLMAAHVAASDKPRPVTSYSVEEWRALCLYTCAASAVVMASVEFLNARYDKRPRAEIRAFADALEAATSPFAGLAP